MAPESADSVEPTSLSFLRWWALERWKKLEDPVEYDDPPMDGARLPFD